MIKTLLVLFCIAVHATTEMFKKIFRRLNQYIKEIEEAENGKEF